MVLCKWRSTITSRNEATEQGGFWWSWHSWHLAKPLIGSTLITTIHCHGNGELVFWCSHPVFFYFPIFINWFSKVLKIACWPEKVCALGRARLGGTTLGFIALKRKTNRSQVARPAGAATGTANQTYRIFWLTYRFLSHISHLEPARAA